MANIVLLACAVPAVLLALYIAYQWLKKELWVVCGPLSPNLFATSSQRPPQPTERDQDKRDRVLKQGFRQDQVPSDLDAIIIGSGIGGLTAGAVLSRAGKKVLVLEQHDRAGGSCHTFVEKGECHMGRALGLLVVQCGQCVPPSNPSGGLIVHFRKAIRSHPYKVYWSLCITGYIYGNTKQVVHLARMGSY